MNAAYVIDSDIVPVVIVQRVVQQVLLPLTTKAWRSTYPCAVAAASVQWRVVQPFFIFPHFPPVN